MRREVGCRRERESTSRRAVPSIGTCVWSVAEQAPGLLDDEVLEQAQATQAVVITSEKDFGELVFRLRRTSHGVVLLRLPGLRPIERADRVGTALGDIADQLVGSFTVVDPTGVRIRST
ncbi:MAG: DUF5615 family PIN-like protein [Planctomycetota bacterium]